MFGLSPAMYSVTASRANKKEGWKLSHKPRDLGAFAHSSSIPFSYSISATSDSYQYPKDIEDLELN